MKKILTVVLLTLVGLTLALPLAMAQQPKKPQTPLTAAFSRYTDQGREIFEVTFNMPMMTDRETMFKNLSEKERPFRLSKDFPAKVFWTDENTLRLESQLSPDDWEAFLNKGPLTLTWKKLQSVENLQPLEYVGGLDGKRIAPLYVKECLRNKRGELYTEIGLEPFAVQVLNQTYGSTVRLALFFNRFMVGKGLVGQELAADEQPFTLSPALPKMTAQWRDRRTLVLHSALKQDEFWETVSDRPFKLSLKRDLQNVHGQNRPDFKRDDFSKFIGLDFKGLAKGAAEFYFSRFALAGLNQASMDLDGWAYFDLTFNKPVKLEEVKQRLKVQKFTEAERNSTKPATAYAKVAAEVLPEASAKDPLGTTVRFRVQGLAGQHIRLDLTALKSADGRGSIEKYQFRESTVEQFFTIHSADLEIEEQYPWKPYFSVNLREELQFRDIENFIKLDPPLPFTVSPYGRDGNALQIFADFTHQPTTVTLLRGMPSRQGVLTENMSYTVALPPNLGSRLIFTGRGRYLSPEKPLLVKLAGRNVDKIRLRGWRVHENNLPAILNVQDYDSPTRTRLALQFSETLLDRTTEVKAEAGEVFERLVDLGQLLDEKPHGAYLLRVSPVQKKQPGEPEDEEDEYYSYYDYTNYPEQYLPVMVSDLGLSAHALPGRVAVWAVSLSGAEAVSGATVKFYDSANQVLAQGATDQNGLFSAEVQPESVIFLTVEKDGDLNYLLLGSRRSSYAGEDYDDYEQDFREDVNAKWFGGNAGHLPVEAPLSKGPMRAYLSRGYEAFLFMPRDMFKPGETVPVKALIRDKNLLPSTEIFPVQWRFYDPDGRTVSQGKAELNALGGLDFKAEIPFEARTGSWSAAVYLPESKTELGRVGFTVEDFVPPRLALELAADQPIYWGENPEMTVEAEVNYLFGAPGANLNWEMDAVISPAPFRPVGWEGFDFSGPITDFETTAQRRVLRGQLDDSGRASIVYQPNLDIGRLPTKMAVEFVISAQEDGGRWNAKRLGVDYFPRNLILGYKAPAATAIKKPFSFQVAAVTPEGKAAGLGQARVRVSQVLTQYYNSYRYGRVYRETAEEFVQKFDNTVDLASGLASVDFTPETAGEYQIEISDPASGLTVARRVSVYGLETAESALPRGVVELSFDRETYRPGDTAMVKVRSPFPGRLWLTVETDALLYSASLEMTGPEAEVRVPVDAAIKTNAVVTASVVRPLAEGQTGYRALGVKSLEIDRDIYKLNVGVEIAERLSPSARTSLKITMTDAEGRPAAGEATVALVDEGVLSLSGFKTPNPWASFTVGRRMLTRFYDLYEQLLPLEKTAVPFLTPGGGDGLGRSGLFSPFKRKQEILSLFLPSVTIDESGTAIVELDIPEYSGQGRLMVVASGRDRFGSASQRLTISRDVTVEATLPLALAPGDRFEIPIRVFAAAEAPDGAGRGASISLRSEGPIRLEESKVDFDLAPGQGETKIFQAVAKPSDPNGDQAGIGRLIIDSRSGLGESFSQSVEVAVRPPYPRVVSSESVQTSGAEMAVTLPTEGYLKGTVQAVLTLAKSPAVEASRAVRYLSEYPYGCLEQTTSQAWIFVAAEDLLAGAAQDSSSEHILYGLDTAVKRLLTMQTTSGGFAFWPGGREVYEWGSVYAVHFLTEAAKKTELPQGLMERSLNWLRAYLGADYQPIHDDPAYILATRAYAVYVLALNGDYRQSWINYLHDRYEGLNPSARIFLAGAEAINAGNAEPLAVLDGPGDWSIDTFSRRVSSLESEARSQALKLLVWTEVDPLSERAQTLAEDVAASGRDGRWRNTQENGLAVFALGSYLNKSGLGKAYRATLTDSKGRALFEAGPNDVAVARLTAEDGPLSLSVTGEGRPFFSLTVGGVPLTAPEPKAEGLALSRTWILDDETKVPLSTPSDTQKLLSIAKGERVIVEILVKAEEPLQNLVLVDLIPGGFEIENPRLVAPGDEEETPAEDDGESFPASRLELREDRLVVIEPWLSEGTTTYRYTLRAVTPGEYALPPTLAEGMYEPERTAVLPGGRVLVKND